MNKLFYTYNKDQNLININKKNVRFYIDIDKDILYIVDYLKINIIYLLSGN